MGPSAFHVEHLRTVTGFGDLESLQQLGNHGRLGSSEIAEIAEIAETPPPVAD